MVSLLRSLCALFILLPKPVVPLHIYLTGLL